MQTQGAVAGGAEMHRALYEPDEELWASDMTGERLKWRSIICVSVQYTQECKTHHFFLSVEQN